MNQHGNVCRHPGNLLRTPDGKLCILDFGLMTEVGNCILSPLLNTSLNSQAEHYRQDLQHKSSWTIHLVSTALQSQLICAFFCVPSDGISPSDIEDVKQCRCRLNAGLHLWNTLHI